MPPLINMANNENAWGASPRVNAALQKELQQLHIYPKNVYQELKTIISQSLKVDAENILLGNGSENLLEMIINCLVSPHQNAIVSEYVFITITNLLHNYRVPTKVIPTLHWQNDIAAMLTAIDENTRLLFIVNPGNPTGSYINKAQFDLLMQSIPPHVIVIMDEAYYEYIAQADYPDSVSYLNRYENLIITRTFSKIYGLAALRIGYAITSATLANELRSRQLPFHINFLAAKAASIAISDQDYLQLIQTNTRLGLEQLQTGLKQRDFSYLKSHGNFITIQVKNSMVFCEHLLKHGIIVKSLQTYQLHDYIRVTVGTAEQNERFLSIVDLYLNN